VKPESIEQQVFKPEPARSEPAPPRFDKSITRKTRWVSGWAALLLGAIVWLPSIHIFFPGGAIQSTSGPMSNRAGALASRHLALWTDDSLKMHELSRMRRSNPEWDFMGRSFLVWSLAEVALREPERKSEFLPVMDQIIQDTIRLEREGGIYTFLMSYARDRPFVRQPARSLFVDSEIALMFGLRRILAEKLEYRQPLHERIDIMIEGMRASSALVAESYPDECWLFDHAVALAAIRVADYLDGTDHSPFLREWLTAARTNLIHAQTGLLISSFTTNGEVLDGPEGSSIWMAAHCLRLVDEEFASDQYRRARKELGRDIGGFAWSREWPVSARNSLDIDSGMVVPVLDASPGGSGLAFVGASSFNDQDYRTKLQRSLDFGGFPLQKNGRLKYCASNQVGDAVLLYSEVLGPIWQLLNERRNR
jgi:hypothetical protein